MKLDYEVAPKVSMATQNLVFIFLLCFLIIVSCPLYCPVCNVECISVFKLLVWNEVKSLGAEVIKVFIHLMEGI